MPNDGTGEAGGIRVPAAQQTAALKAVPALCVVSGGAAGVFFQRPKKQAE